ncbi:DUF2905 domain-containing protein [Thermovibrio ammonificans]|jgi:hypothetical protein|uniref:DUF2905 domain-containing protein n=1 Tax=Thermovibrio ammonificans (strain DSM 15698 / JCM 12110 / HB-1) TaxID=648996 RepID=E8T6E3_THEA1|nr:DUF2905 domain-containing protein [Thermovibrio ammonificans]ADU96727.1 hypothetical protein Theam_0760 [Thermovibrio ammonificans HB-1]
MVEEIGKLLIFVGVTLVAFGIVLIVVAKLGSSGIPLGRLPGDIYIKKDNFVFYFPITTSLLVSLLLSLLSFLLFFFTRKQ